MRDKSSGGFSRRQLLHAGMLSSLSAIAGCNQSNTPTESESEVPGDGESTESTATVTTQDKDTSGPVISTLTAAPGEDRGSVSVTVEATASAGITTLSVSTAAGSTEQNYDAQQTVTETLQVDAPPGETTAIKCQIIDAAENTITQEVTGYAPRHAKPAGQSLSAGAKYRFHQQYDPGCLDATPVAGAYTEYTSSLGTRHADQLRGSGIDHITVDVAQRRKLDAVAQFTDTPLGAEIGVQFRYQFLAWTERGISLEEQTAALADQIADLEQYDHHNSRPVIVLPHLESVQHRDAKPLWETLIERHGDLQGIIRTIRDGLTIGGTVPFLVGETVAVQDGWAAPHFHEQTGLETLLRELDGVQNGLLKPTYVQPAHDESVVDEWMQRFQKQLRVLHQFATKHGLEFIPQVTPGMIDSHRGCPPEKQLPRRENRFQAMLAYAASYATTDRVTIDSFNDWQSGTQIEPGEMLGTTYDDAYLNGVRSVVEDGALFEIGGQENYHVTEDGDDLQQGTESEPLASVQEGLMRAGPGDTVTVHAGRYQERAWTVRDGDAGAPITITGDEDAVLQPPQHGLALWFKNSHIHLTGLTLDGLLDPENPEEVESYCDTRLIESRPPDDADDYLEDIVCAPAGIGNAGRALMVFQRTNGLEVGPLRIIGLAGAEYNVGDLESHVGEFVYLGQPPRVIAGREHEEYNWADYPWKGELDETRNVHIHHIDNSAGHLHSEFVDAKTGTRDVLVEYCTDAGGANNTESWTPNADVRLHSHKATVRWCDFRNGQDRGLHVVDHSDFVSTLEDPAVTPAECGTDHSIYGNRFTNFPGEVMVFDTSPEAQRVICGNDVDGQTQGTPEAACPTDIPTSPEIGHLAGDSPWS